MQHIRNPLANGLNIGLIIAFALLLHITAFGWQSLDPASTAWLLRDEPAQHYLGWYFFRHEPWHWPLGRIEGFGLPAGSSVAMTDAIPLLAIPFKLLSPLLPEHFQYFGLWMLACFMLNGYFGLRLMARLSEHASLRFLGALFFVLSPVLLFRAHGHEALMAQWMILAACERYYSGWKGRYWLLLCAIAALCHPYLLFMVLALYAAALLDAARSGSVPLRWLGAHVAFCALFVLGLLWTAGYLLDGPVDRSGYGYFSMNLLALFDPQFFNASRFFSQHAFSPDFAPYGQYEGFLYLGAGMLLLLAVGTGACLAGSKPARVLHWLRRDWPLYAAALTLWLLALSTKVMLGSWHLFTVPVPAAVEQVLSTFRASGRFGWPLFYLLNLYALALVVRYLPRRGAQCVLLAALALQLLDQYPKYQEFRTLFQARAATVNTLPSPRWGELARHAERLVLLPPHPAMENIYIPFAHFAARHRLATNAARLARTLPGDEAAYGATSLRRLTVGERDPATIYVLFERAGLAALPAAVQADLIELDGYWVVPPVAATLDATHAR